jgi:type II secretory pathway pseudopilin PulG
MPNKAGFTLVEIIVASVVFALTIAGLLSVFVAGSKHIIHTRERITSAELGKLFIDPLQTDVRQDTWNSNALGTLAIPTASETINNTLFTATYAAADSSADPALAGTDLRRVTTTITWNELSP